VAPITKSSLVSGRFDGQWGMPPLSAYTSFESLLFFQSLAALDARPASFAAISDTLRSNPFIRENAAFDANRLSPEALEELYTTLLQDWLAESRAVADQNGHRPDAPSANPKKRKITSPTAENVNAADLAKSHTTIVPGLVSQLYARYKEGVTREIRNDEKRYREIREEIEQLQRQEVKEHVDTVPKDVPAAKVPEQPPQIQAAPVPDVTELDIKQGKQVQAPGVGVSKPPEVPAEVLQQKPETTQVQQAAKVDIPQQPVPPVPTANPPQTRPSPAVPPVSAPQHAQQQALPPPPAAPAARIEVAVPNVPSQLLPPGGPVVSSGQPPQAGLVGGNVPALAPTQQPVQNPSPALPVKTPVKIPPAPQPSRQHVQPSTRAAGPPSRDRPALPPGSTIVFPAQKEANVPSPSPGTQRPARAGEAAGRKGSAAITGPPMMPQFPLGQQPFQQWSPHPSPQTPYSNMSPYANSPYSTQPVLDRRVPPQQVPAIPQRDGGRPLPGPYSATGPMTPGPFPVAVPSPLTEVAGQQTPTFARTPSFSTTFSKRPSRPSVDTAGSITPWKRSPRLSLSIPQSPGSPIRPRPEDVSPISERAPSPIEPLGAPATEAGHGRKRPDTRVEKPRRGRKRSVPPLELEHVDTKVGKSTAKTRAKRAASTASTRSRGRSVASRDDESATDSGSATLRKIKHEAPATPAGISEDTEVEPRAGTRRRAAAGGGPGDERLTKGRIKRKRGASESLEVDAGQPTPIRPESTQFVLCTRNFPRTGAPIMNDVAAHKHASIFAKPLTEREAPGYKDLIYRPQDLKSIKSAIHQGSRAVAAATEAASTPADGESPNPAAGTPSKNAVLMLQKTADLIPPKGIVNSSQLEKELIRMFANAVMFNPAPDRERGFGPAFPMTKGNGSRMSAQPWEGDEGGIIHDTREMCDDVEQAVTRWRAAERTADELGNKSFLSLRRGSDADGADEMKG
jgi:hypothetical protein